MRSRGKQLATLRISQRNYFADLRSSFGMRLEKLGKPVAAKFEQLGVGARANSGRARLTRHQRHLAKEGRPREIAHMDLFAVLRCEDFDRAAAHYVERAAIVAFAHDH